VPGLSFPATDELGNDRGSPASAGAYELNPITLDTNAAAPTISNEPQNQAVGKGVTVTMTVSAVNNDTNNNNLGYQWQLNGTNLSDNNTFIGSTSNILTIKNVTAADEGSYQVIVSASLLEGAATSSPPALLTIIAPPKITIQPAGKPNAPDGSVVAFSATVTGSMPLSYQWYEVTADSGTNMMLTDTNEISGSTASALTINPATAANDGSYFVVVSNQYGAATSAKALLSIVPDTTKPTVAISSPAAAARTTNLVVTGTATDKAQVTNVNYWVTNVNAGIITTSNGSASLGTNGTTAKTWSITNVFLPGTNYVTVQSVDYSGNRSALATREFFYQSQAQFTLNVIGPGTVTGSTAFAGDVRPTNNAMLNIGEGYTLTAAPDKNCVLSNWTSSTGLTHAPFHHGNRPDHHGQFRHQPFSRRDGDLQRAFLPIQRDGTDRRDAEESGDWFHGVLQRRFAAVWQHLCPHRQFQHLRLRQQLCQTHDGPRRPAGPRNDIGLDQRGDHRQRFQPRSRRLGFFT
jgi:hypothetical protein